MMAFNPAAGVQKQHGQTFTFRVVVRMGGNVQPPIVGGFVRGVALLQGFRGWAFPQGHHLELVGTGGKLERLNKVIQAGENGRPVIRSWRVSFQAAFASAGK